ncbi:hypothetical protein PN437_02520, partial [Microcystis aeruginosa CS-564/01]|uniref:hypothetical protein n=1 Tax=Microcystis aeruginosa TaxID=1126 RepID=UPI00232DEEB1
MSRYDGEGSVFPSLFPFVTSYQYSGVRSQYSGVRSQESVFGSQESVFGSQKSGDYFIYSPHTPHPTPHT